MRGHPVPRRRPYFSRRWYWFRPRVEQCEPRLAPSVDILTYHNNAPGNNSGANLNETQLTPDNVRAGTFGQLFNYPVDGQIYGEPLIKTNVAIPGKGIHDVVYVVTQHDSVYAFDANSGSGASASPLWHDSFINPAAGITTVPSGDTGSGDIRPEIGITATPTIDPTTGTLYVVSKTKEMRADGAHYVQKLHALDIGSGAEKFNGPVLMGDTINNGGPDQGFTDTTPIFVPGTGDSTNGTDVFFNALRENERAGEFIANNVLYLSFTSHGDTQPYHGWLLGYNPQTLQLVSIYCTTPNGTEGAIWMGGAGPAVDGSGFIYFTTGNGTFDAGSFGPTALGGGGGALGYQGITNSVSVRFRAFGNPANTTGLGTNGNFGPDVNIPGFDFNGGAHAATPHQYQATLTYNASTMTLSETVTDVTTSTMFSTSYNVNIAAVVGGTTGFVGFTAGTGSFDMEQDVKTWTFSNGTTTIDHSGGFASNSDLQANGNANFPAGLAQLTPNNFNQVGSIFTKNAVNVAGNWTTTFTFQMIAGTNPVADGLTFTVENAPQGQDFAMTTEKLSPTPGANKELPVLSFFTPHDEASLSGADLDQGSGGVLLLPDSAGSAAHPHLLVQTGKTGRIYVLDRDNLGGFNSAADNVVQVTPDGTLIGGSYDMPAFFNNGTQQLIYYMGSADVLKAFAIANGQINPTPVAQTNDSILFPGQPAAEFQFPGSTPIISANGTRNGIVWALDGHLNGSEGHPNSGAEVLHAYDATTLRELYNSSELGQADLLGNGVKFTVPTVANGKVYVGTQTGLYVFGLFPQATAAPAAPTGLDLTVNSATSITLTWTNHATNARNINIFRSTGDAGNLTLVTHVNRNTTTFTDTGLTPSTRYFYQVVASNSAGDSDPSNAAHATTTIAPSVLQVTATGPSVVQLSWTPTADAQYVVQRSTDGVNFTTVGTVSDGTTRFTDTNVAANIYFYRVEGIDLDGETAFSNVVNTSVGLQTTVNHAIDFSSNSDLTANGTAGFANISGSSGGINAVGAVLTDGFSFNQAGTVFTNTKQNITTFTTTFVFQPVFELTIPVADGMTFIIQGNSPTALGGAGGGLGYQGINNSVAFTFRAFDPSLPGSDSSTELGENGAFLPATNVDITAATASAPGGPMNFQATADTFPPNDAYSATLSYNGITLFETIQDLTTGTTFQTSFNVNIPALVGGNTAFIGFGGGDGGLTLTNEVFTWTYATIPPASALPPAPSNLKIADVQPDGDGRTADVHLTWTINAANQTGTSIERSSDGVNFTPIATVGANAMSFTDQGVSGAGTFYYRVRAFNANGNSAYSNVDSVRVGLSGQIVTVDHSAGFASHADLTANGSATFSGSFLRLTDGNGGEAGSGFATSRVGVTSFSTTFTFRMHDGTNPMADGMAFVIQANSPTAVGPQGGGLGYGPDNPAGPKGIPNSVAIKFDLFDNQGEYIDSTGIFFDGDSPTLPTAKGESSVDLSGSGIDLHSQDVFRVTLTYDGNVLTEVITDTVTNATFTHTYTVNIAARIGGNVGYAGFTAGTGGDTTVADIQTWTYQFRQPDAGSGGAAGPGVAPEDSALGSALVGVTQVPAQKPELPSRPIGLSFRLPALLNPVTNVGTAALPHDSSRRVGDGTGVEDPLAAARLDDVFGSGDLSAPF